MPADSKHIKLLEYWNMLEYLNPVQMPKEYKVLKKNRLPWNEPRLNLKPGEKPEKVKYTIYLNSFSAKDFYKFIQVHFNSLDTQINYPSSNYLTAAIEVNQEGYYVRESFQLSMLPFVLSQLKKKKADATVWKEKFEFSLSFLNDRIEKEILTNEVLMKPLTYSIIDEIENLISSNIIWDKSEQLSICYVQNRDVGNGKRTNHTIINSHILNDLRSIIDRGKGYNFKTPLKNYLNSGINKEFIEHSDVNENVDIIKESIRPENFPDGRWPSIHTLSLMQQFAVNKIVEQLSDPKSAPIYSVNGPPGTGKTTLLRDIIAYNVVAKAKEQVAIENPQKIFSKVEDIVTNEDESLSFYPLKKKYEKLNDFAMMVVSSNNGAVENITRELPLKKEVEGFVSRLKYFTQFEEKHSNGDNWGAISAVLGKRDNLTAFIDKAQNGENSLANYLRNNRKTDLKDWEKVVASFNKKLKEVHQEKTRITELLTSVKEYHQLQKEYDVLLTQVRGGIDENVNSTELEEKLGEINRIEGQLEKLSEVITDNEDPNLINDKYWNNLDLGENQKKCPWYFKTLNQLQSDLFIEALKVNECFIHTANGNGFQCISNNLEVFLELIGSYSSINLPDKSNAKIWQSFFQIIPVVSSTFASVQYMLRKVKTDFIPWLFIDEAGQALPQLACGAIWRAKRVLAVGDPFQIEPVDTMPTELRKLLLPEYNLSTEDLRGNFSVQNLTDKNSLYGANVESGNDSFWIGTPLKVHRRCIEPMFSIANRISYNDSMVCATQLPESIGVKINTCFWDVKGETNGRHFVQNQANVVIELILKSFEGHELNIYLDFPSLFIITPFSEISKELRRQLKEELISKLSLIDKKRIRTWVDKSVGTVHTFQGKQAEGVILLLGCDQKSKMAARWAANKPNLLNVALTRAKYKFLVVGDGDLWLNLPYFKELNQLHKI